MQQKTINLYEYSELSPEAKKKALDYHQQHGFDDYGLQVCLDNEIETLLEEAGITPVAPTQHPKLYYSLANCQGDGVMFEGNFEWNNIPVTIKQYGRYYHAYSKEVDMPEASEKERDSFEDVYVTICKKLEKLGYQYIEDVESESYFIEECNANEYLFLEDGTRDNR